MLTIFKHEIKLSVKSLIIWFVCVGGMGLACILLYSSMKGDMAAMAETFASMGAFADAFGMSQLSIATLIGFYATEVGTIHGLGGAMFAAIMSTCMLSKEEDAHTSEFLFSMPLSRTKVVFSKWCAILTNIFAFNILCVLLYIVGFVVQSEEIPVKEFALYHSMQIVLQVEIAAICYAISAFMKKNKFGLGLGIVLMLYVYDLMARVIPDLADYKFISPFSYANAADILSGAKFEWTAFILGIIILNGSIVLAFRCYVRRDLAS